MSKKHKDKLAWACARIHEAQIECMRTNGITIRADTMLQDVRRALVEMKLEMEGDE